MQYIYGAKTVKMSYNWVHRHYQANVLLANHHFVDHMILFLMTDDILRVNIK